MAPETDLLSDRVPGVLAALHVGEAYYLGETLGVELLDGSLSAAPSAHADPEMMWGNTHLRLCVERLHGGDYQGLLSSRESHA